MYLTQTNIIRNLTKDEYFQLREMCFFSNCLYNVALYNIRRQYFQDKTYLKYPKNEPFCKQRVKESTSSVAGGYIAGCIAQKKKE